jgi:hypothetical protein
LKIAFSHGLGGKRKKAEGRVKDGQRPDPQRKGWAINGSHDLAS